MRIFEDIYEANGWNGNESLSGPGSGDAATLHVATAITDLVAELGVLSVLDLGCGDGYWMPDLPGYIGVDASSKAIETAQARHPDREYIVGNAGTMRLPTADLVICRDAIQHLSLADGSALLANITTSRRHRWLLMSTYVGGSNVDIETGHFYSPDMTGYPFLLPDPDRYIFDGYGYFDADQVRDPGKHLGLWRL